MIQLLIGAATSGSGKTTFTMGLLRALSRRGLRVQPFKCGPDYIDTQFHSIAAGRESVNLDTWMASPEHVREVYAHYCEEADVAVIEGVMGLFDGYDRMRGSSAEIAALLGVPVVLVVNARSSAYTVAALLHGMKTFRPEVKIAGVVFNQVASESHYAFLKDAAADAGVECLGWMPRADGIEVPSRHLGLTIGMEQEISALADRVADLIEQNVQLGTVPFCTLKTCKRGLSPIAHFVTAVARDRAFNFTYRENIDRLREMGEVVFFSPLAGDELPEADLVYLPGGYPELFAPELSLNRMLASQLVQYAEKGGKILAECGGMMYLGRSVTDQEGKVWPMAGVLPIECTMEGARLHLGYRKMTVGGVEFKGHEFHYSKCANGDSPLLHVEKMQKGTVPNCTFCIQYNAKGDKVDTAIYRYKNVIAGYTHWYWGETDINALWEL
ncbi:MAG: cobyrinate a,c-diamide synthase [Bacteroidaceae bacterium]|nr:cobyrinate a,c-diamide synthase [Bacteroidaceae bacterium]